MLKNERGALHILSLFVVILALFGAWFLYKSFQEQRLKASVMEAVNGYRQIIESAIRDPWDRDVAHEYLQKVQDIVERNQSKPQGR
jgi:predicted negative regulator of RcsB-dependent stress response